MLLPLQWYPCYAYTDCNKRHRFSYPSKIHVQLQNLSSLLRQRSYSVFFPIMFRLCVTHEIHSRHTVSPISFQLSSDEKCDVFISIHFRYPHLYFHLFILPISIFMYFLILLHTPSFDNLRVSLHFPQMHMDAHFS